jgi:hypothetical protein
MKEIHNFLERKSVQKPEACNLEELWSKHSKEVGLLLSERLVNIPIELAPPLYQGLFDEIFWATEDEVRNTIPDFRYLMSSIQISSTTRMVIMLVESFHLVSK